MCSGERYRFTFFELWGPIFFSALSSAFLRGISGCAVPPAFFSDVALPGVFGARLVLTALELGIEVGDLIVQPLEIGIDFGKPLGRRFDKRLVGRLELVVLLLLVQ